MPLTQSFIVATDAALTIEYGGYEDTDHYTDESDNPQYPDVLYLGSTNTTVKLQTLLGPGSSDITLTPTDILPKWVASTAYTVGRMTQPLAAPNGYRYQCTTAGTTGSTEPVWVTGIGTTVISGTAVFTCVSPKHQPTELTVALSYAALATNTPGAALSLGNTILGGTANAVKIYIKVENGVDVVSNNAAYPEIALVLNSLREATI